MHHDARARHSISLALGACSLHTAHIPVKYAAVVVTVHTVATSVLLHLYVHDEQVCNKRAAASWLSANQCKHAR